MEIAANTSNTVTVSSMRKTACSYYTYLRYCMIKMTKQKSVIVSSTRFVWLVLKAALQVMLLMMKLQSILHPLSQIQTSRTTADWRTSNNHVYSVCVWLTVSCPRRQTDQTSLDHAGLKLRIRLKKPEKDEEKVQHLPVTLSFTLQQTRWTHSFVKQTCRSVVGNIEDFLKLYLFTWR